MTKCKQYNKSKVLLISKKRSDLVCHPVHVQHHSSSPSTKCSTFYVLLKQSCIFISTKYNFKIKNKIKKFFQKRKINVLKNEKNYLRNNFKKLRNIRKTRIS